MNKLIWMIAAAGISSTIAHADKVFRTGKGATWDCRQDPVVNIEHGRGTYTFKGSCQTINLTGGHNTLTVESSATLNITGGDNTVTIDAVDTINLIGSNNTVTYKAALRGDSPSVSKIGSNNRVTRGGGGDRAAGKPADRPARADAAGAQDCASNPTAVIDTGDGNYRFVGPCTRIVINGGENTVAIESVKEISINGSENTVAIDAADKILVVGSENKVSYKKGLSGARPRISSVGQNNTVTQVK